MSASFDRIDSRGKDVEPTANLVGSFSKRVQHGGVPLSPKNFGSLLRETFFESILALTLSSLFFYSKRGTHTQVGLDAAGKTTILYKLKLGEIVTTIPTIGTFSVFLLRVFTNGFFSPRFFVFHYFALKIGIERANEKPQKLSSTRFLSTLSDRKRPKTERRELQVKKKTYFYYLAFNITTHHDLTEPLKTIQVSTSKRSNTRTFRSRCGMSEDKTKFVRCGDTTSKTRKA